MAINNLYPPQISSLEEHIEENWRLMKKWSAKVFGLFYSIKSVDNKNRHGIVLGLVRLSGRCKSEQVQLQRARKDAFQPDHIYLQPEIKQVTVPGQSWQMIPVAGTTMMMKREMLQFEWHLKMKVAIFCRERVKDCDNSLGLCKIVSCKRLVLQVDEQNAARNIEGERMFRRQNSPSWNTWMYITICERKWRMRIMNKLKKMLRDGSATLNITWGTWFKQVLH